MTGPLLASVNPLEALTATGRPWRLLTGSAAGRTATAVAAIDQLCARLSRYADPLMPAASAPRAADARAR